MNERIRKLAKQAGFGLHRDGEIYTSRLEHLPITEDIEKFAELIVRECIDIVSPYAIRMENFDGGHPIDDLKKHFGVEE